VIIAENAVDLQRGINDFQHYCNENSLKVNRSKTKVMIFGKGRIPEAEFTLGEGGGALEKVKYFKYLGLTFSVQMAFTEHVFEVNARARQRIAYLYWRLPLHEMNLELVVNLFITYILPMYTYCSPIWSVKLSDNAVEALNVVFMNYLRRYFCLPKHSHRAALYYYTNTRPLHDAVRNLSMNAITKIAFPPDALEGYQLSFANQEELPRYNAEEEMSPDYPRERVFISRNKFYRKRTFRDLFMINHYKVCTTVKFHTTLSDSCRCIMCNSQLKRGHECCDKDYNTQ